MNPIHPSKVRPRGRALASFASLFFLPASGMAEAGPRHGLYGSVFGGVAWSARQDVKQTGAAHMRGDHALPGYKDFDLLVDTRGRATSERAGMFGANVGYRFDTRDSRIAPSVELEAAHLSRRQSANLRNPAAERIANVGSGSTQVRLDDPLPTVTDKYGAGKHRFANRMDIDTNLVMLNAVFAYKSHGFIEPYLGVGIGMALVDAGRAVSHQTNPSGPIEVSPVTGERVNHFNGRTRDRDAALAWQAKAGVSASLGRHLALFLEYRLVHVGATDFVFGSTRYAGHAPTERWRVRNGAMRTHAGVLGVQYRL